jgi:hypothetical protein
MTVAELLQKLAATSPEKGVTVLLAGRWADVRTVEEMADTVILEAGKPAPREKQK